MFFTKAGRVLAWLAVFAGVYRAGIGFYAAFTENEAVLRRYLGSGTTAEAIDQGLMMLAVGIALGIVTDISRSLAN